MVMQPCLVYKMLEQAGQKIELQGANKVGYLSEPRHQGSIHAKPKQCSLSRASRSSQGTPPPQSFAPRISETILDNNCTIESQ